MAENGQQNGNGAQYDKELYGGDRYAGYHTSIALDEEEEEEQTMAPRSVHTQCVPRPNHLGRALYQLWAILTILCCLQRCTAPPVEVWST
jgi:hypothetical protein